MDTSPTGLAKLLLPLVPLVFKTAVLNALSLSEGSSKQDNRTEITVAIIRSILTQRKPLGQSQRLSVKDPGIKGQLWVSKATALPPPEQDALDAVLQAIKILGDGAEDFSQPEAAAVEGEWTGFRADVDKKAPRPDLSESEHYAKLMSETTSPTTVLYFHGGAYFLMDPASHRLTCSQLGKHTGGRCFNVRYRLAPQYPFPAQLLEAFIAYLYLLSPTADAYHTPVDPSHIVFAGDSAGGNLSFALLLLILTLLHNGTTHITFHGKSVPLAVPAGVTGNSPWLDITNSLPSIHSNSKYDYLRFTSPTITPPTTGPLPDHLWPTNPPRSDIFCPATLLTHPLVSPCLASIEQWKGAPPIWACAGDECLTDSITHTCRTLSAAGSPVTFFGAEGMPHVFPMVFPSSAQGKEGFKSWTDFMRDVVEGPEKAKERGSKAIWMRPSFKREPVVRDVEIEDLCDVSEDVVRETLTKTKAESVRVEEELIKAWREGDDGKAANGRAKL